MNDNDDTIIISGSSDITLDISNQGAACETFTITDMSDTIDFGDINTTITLPETTYIGPGATVGGIYTTTGTTPSYSYNNYTFAPNETKVNIDADGVKIKEDGDLKIGDASLKDFMSKVEDQLAILRPAPELEEKWDKLKELRRQYEECKQDILEKEKIMKILKEE